MAMYQPTQSPIPAPLADLIRTAQMVTSGEERRPTIAAQYVTKAQEMLTPPMAQMPQTPMMPAGVMDVARDAALGNAVQMGNQQRQQQEMMQMLQQLAQRQGAQDNAMRFGVAAAPGAETVRMAEGGIVGYAAGTPEPHPLSEADELKRQLERLARLRKRAGVEAAFTDDAAAAARAAAPAAETAAARTGVGALLRGAGATGMRALGPLGAIATPLLFGIPTRGGEAQMGGDNEPSTPAGDDYQRQRIESTYRDVNRPEFGLGTPPAMPPAEDEIDKAAAAARAGMRPPAPPQAGIVSLQAPTADRTLADAQLARAAAAQEGMETARATPAEIIRRQQEKDAAMADYYRSMGVEPDQYKKDIATSEERKARRLAGIGALEAQSQEARSGVNRMIELLSAGAGRVLPGGLSQQHVNMLRRDLAENERFLNARERVMEAEDTIQAAIREKRRAEVTGNIKAMEDATAEEQKARNAKRQADIVVSTELAKAFDTRVEKALDRQTSISIENLRAQVHREATKAQQEGNLEMRRSSLLAALNKTEEASFANIDEIYNKRTSMLVLPGAKLTKEQQQELMDAQLERDLAKAGVRMRLAPTREEIMSMGGGGGGGIKVIERTK